MHKKGISLVVGSAVGVLAVGVTLCAGGASAVEQTSSATATVNVAVGACTFERTSGSGTYTGTLANGAAPIPVPGSTFKTLCNDGGGYAVYAIGYSNNEASNTDLISNLGSEYNIHTGAYPTTTSSTPSFWAMKLENNSDDYAPAVINNTTGSDFTTFHAVPNNYTIVASYNGSTLDPSSGSNTGSTIKATYQAYASYTQPAGTYTGQVKYTMVHPNDAEAPTIVDDMTYLQDFANLSANDRAALINSMPTGKVYTKKDKRDNQDYTFAKLADGKVWMTKNLNLPGGTALSSTDTDFDSNYGLPIDNGWTVSGGKLVLPASSTSGFDTDNYAYVANSGSETCAENSPCYSYYSWDAATLGSGRDIATDNTDASYSICPKGWKLPTSRTTDATNWQTGSDFYALAHQYGLDSTTSTAERYSGFYTLAGPNTIPGFLLTGLYYENSFLSGGQEGAYWSSTSVDDNNGRFLFFSSLYIESADFIYRAAGIAVRCFVAE